MYFLTRISPELSLFLDTQKMKHFTIIDLQFSGRDDELRNRSRLLIPLYYSYLYSFLLFGLYNRPHQLTRAWIGI
jgi:hypothetical protein